jgi:hypothetical protein
VLSLVLAASACNGGCGDESKPDPGEQPNIVWIVAEDMSFEIGAFGDPVARTPNLDRLAAEGVIYTNAFSTSGVCAPSRASLITGHYAATIGAHHMRSIDRGYQPVPPPEVKTFTEHLRAAGYYTSNQLKLDYQFSGVFSGAPITNWDEPNGLWHRREPGQPFFAYITIYDTHESRLLGDGSSTTTDAAALTVPPYYPDTPLVRTELARFYDNVEAMDAQVGQILGMLEDEGLLESTVVMFFPDNGRGFPRDKRWIYDGGIHEPLIVRWPAPTFPITCRAASSSDRGASRSRSMCMPRRIGWTKRQIGSGRCAARGTSTFATTNPTRRMASRSLSGINWRRCRRYSASRTKVASSRLPIGTSGRPSPSKSSTTPRTIRSSS